MKKIILFCLLFLFAISCQENPTNPDSINSLPFLNSISPSPISRFENIIIRGRNFTDSRNKFDIYMETFKVDSSKILYWKDSIIIFWLDEKADIANSSGKLFLKYKQSSILQSNKLDYKFIDKPYTLNISPEEAYTGDTLVLKGANLGKMTDSSFVLLQGNKNLKAKIVQWNDNTIKFINSFENDNNDFMIYVEVYNGNKKIHDKSTIRYNSIIPPKINSIAPNVSSWGKSVVLTGQNFGSNKENLKIYLGTNEIKSFSFIDNSNLNIIIPENTASGEIFILRKGKPSNKVFLKIIENPVINSLNKNDGSPGDILEIYGKSFGYSQEQTKVYFMDISAEIISFSQNKISCKVPEITNHSYVSVHVEGIKSNELLFRIPNGISLGDELEYIVFCVVGKNNGVEVDMFSDTLKHIKSGNYDYYEMYYQPPGQSEPITAAIQFDKQTFSLEKISFYYYYFTVNASQISSLTRKGVRTQGYEKIPLNRKAEDSLIYIFDKSKGTFYGYNEQVHWEDYRHGNSGDYNESGKYPLENLPGYKIVFKKVK